MLTTFCAGSWAGRFFLETVSPELVILSRGRLEELVGGLACRLALECCPVMSKRQTFKTLSYNN